MNETTAKIVPPKPISSVELSRLIAALRSAELAVYAAEDEDSVGEAVRLECRARDHLSDWMIDQISDKDNSPIAIILADGSLIVYGDLVCRSGKSKRSIVLADGSLVVYGGRSDYLIIVSAGNVRKLS